MLLLWELNKEFDNPFLSNYIDNNRNDYYKSIELSEKYNDLTYSLIFIMNSLI